MASKGKGKKTERVPKRSRKEPASSSNLNPTLDNLGIDFRSASEVARFTALRSKRLRPTQFPDTRALRELGIHGTVFSFHMGLGSVGFLELHEKTYERLTLEFLCTLRRNVTVEVCSQTGASYNLFHLNFRLGGEEFHITSFDINRILGWPSYTNVDADLPIEFRDDMLWNQITGIPSFKSRSAKASSIIHPALRLLHRMYACTIFAREDKGTVNRRELFLLWCFVREHRKINLSHFLIELISDIITPTYNGEIYIGGLVTLFAKHVGFVIPNDWVEVKGSTKLDIPTLRTMQLISDRGRGEFNWLVGPGKTPYIILPNTNLPSAQPNQPETWTFPNALIQNEGQEEGEEEQAPQNQNQLPPEFYQMFGQMNDIYGYMNDLRENVDNIRSDVHSMRGNVDNLRGDVQGLREDIHEMRGDIRDAQGRINYAFNYGADHWPDFSPPPPPM